MGAALEAPGDGVAITTTVNLGNADETADDAATDDDTLAGTGCVAATDDCGADVGCPPLHAASTIINPIIEPSKIERRSNLPSYSPRTNRTRNG